MLWSTRTSSSRQTVGSEIVFVKAGNGAPLSWFKPFVVFAVGIRDNKAEPTGVMGTAAGFAKFGQSVPGQMSEKSPARSASEGTFWRTVDGFFSRRHSCDQKKNVLLRSEL